MPHHRRYSYDPRASSPPLVGRIPTPPHRRTTWDRADSPPLVRRIPTPPLRARSLTPTERVETRVYTTRIRQPEATAGSRFYNIFRPRRQRVELVESPIRPRHTVRVHRAPTPPPAPRRPHTVRRRSPPPVVFQSVIPPVPLRRNPNHGMSPRVPQDYVPLPDKQPPLGSPSPPNSTGRHPSGSPHGRGDQFASPWTPHEVIGEDRPRVTEPRPVRANPGNREAVLSEQNKEYRDRLKRLSQELEQKKADVFGLQAREEELLNQLADANARARRATTAVSAELDDLRDRLQRCELDRQELQHERDQQRRESERREREFVDLRRRSQPPVIIYDDDEPETRPRPRPQPTREASESAGLAAIREAQARGRGRSTRGYRG